MHSTIRNNLFILTQELVYSNLPIGKLEEQGMVSNLIFPHQQGFYRDSKARFPVAIDCLPAFALEQGIVGTVMPFSQSTAVAAPFGSVVGINNIQNSVFIKTSAFKQLPESIEGNTHNLFVKPFSFRKSLYSWGI